MVTPSNTAAAPVRTLVEFDADTLRISANQPGVAPLLRCALGSLFDAVETAGEHFGDAAVNGANRVQSNDLALVIARGLIERLQADLNAAAADQEKYLRDELARFEQMQLE